MKRGIASSVSSDGEVQSILNERSQATYRVSLPSFEGPLDLLLHLVQKHELNVLELPVAFITEKYLEFISFMETFQIDIASEYLVMAATLAYLKSKLMLPPDPKSENEPDIELDPIGIRENLIRRLLEYQKFKEAAHALGERPVEGRDVFLRQQPPQEENSARAPLAEVSVFKLFEAFQKVMKSTKVKVRHEVHADRLTITERINEVCEMLRKKNKLDFMELLHGEATRFDLVITFLAILEMTRLRMTRIQQLEPYAPLQVELTVTDEGLEEAKKRLPTQ